MSKTVDERVVEMRFDNSQFEKNVSTTMSTLDKFKQKLNFGGVKKGFEEVGSAAQKVDMRGLGAGVDAVSAKFSALQIMGTTALVNITNSAVNAGKRMVNALTLEPVMSGFQEYETQMNAVQTILANTQSKGSTLDDVNKALDELNHYADLTIYNFTEMTRNIGTFTAAGVDLETSVNAIQGIANLAAVSGSTSQQASVAMYQLSQALAAGTVKLTDWNSVVTAGMGGEIFQNALKKTSELLGTGAEAAIKAKGSFRESLSTGWLTSQVLTETLKKFTTSGANEYVAEYTGLSADAVKATLESAKSQYGEANAVKEAAKALAEKSGKNREEIEQALQMAQTAENAATKVKTFSQLWGVMKEAAQSGWARTWQIIVGDFEEAKNLLTPLSDFFTGVIGKISDARNKLLEGALGMGFKSLADKFNTIMTPAKNAADTISKVKDSVADLSDIVNQVIRGNFGNGKERIDKLTAAGQNYYRVQNKVNEALGNSFRYSDKRIAVTDRLLGIQKETADATAKVGTETEKLTDEQKKFIKELTSMTEEQARANNYTEQIAALKELVATAEKLGIPVEELIDNLDEINGRWLLINSFKNIGQGLITVIKAISSAWRDIFPAMQAEQLFNLIAGFHKLTTQMKVSDETADKIRRTFKGLFAALDIILTVVSGPLKIGFKILQQLLSAFDLTIFDITANIGDAIVKFRDWIDSVFDMSGVFEMISPYIATFIETIKDFFKSLKDWKLVNKMVAALKKLTNTVKKLLKFDVSDISFGDILTRIKDAFASAPKAMKEIGANIIEGLQNGLGDRFATIVKKAKEIATMIINTIKNVLGIHSPSAVMFEIGENVVAGLINGIGSGIQFVIEGVAKVGNYIINAFKKLDFGPLVDTLKNGIEKLKGSIGNFDWKKLLAIIPIGVVLVVVKQMYDFVSAISDGIGSVNKVIDGLAGVEKSISKVLDAKAFETAASALEKIAKSIAILAVAVLILANVPEENLYRSVGVIVVLSIVLSMLSKAVTKIQAASARIDKDGVKIAGLKTGLLTITAALLALGVVVKMMSGLTPDKMKQGFVGLAGVIGAVIVLLLALQLLALIPSKNLDLIGPMMLKVAVVIGIMALVCKLVSGLTPEDMANGAIFAGGFLVFMAMLNLIALIPSTNIDKLGGMLLKVSFALVLMVGVVKLASMLDLDTINAARPFMTGMLLFILCLQIIDLIPGDGFNKLGSTLMGISVALVIMVGVVKLASKLDPDELKSARSFVEAFLVFVLVLKIIGMIPGESMLKLAGTLLAMSVAIGILAGVAILLSMMPDQAALANATMAVVMLGLMMAAMIAATKGAQKSIGNIIAMTIAVGLIAGALVLLSSSNIDLTRLAAATGAMAVVMGMFVLIEKMSGKMTNVTGTLFAMAVVVGILGGVLYLLAGLPAESSIGAAVALSLAMLAFAGVMQIISGMKGPSASALGAIVVMGLVIGGLGGVLYLLRDVNPVQGIATVGVITAFLAALLIAVMAMQLIQAPAIVGLIALGAATLVVGALAGVLYLLKDVDPTQAIQVVGVITAFLIAMEVVCLAASLVGSVAGPAIVGLGILLLFIGALGLVVYGLAKLAMDVIADMPKVGSDLSAFMTNVQPFIDGVQNIPDDISDKIGKLSAAILKLTGANIVKAIGDFLSGGNSLSDLGNELQSFGEGMAAFSSSMTNVDSAIASLSKIKDFKEAIPDVDLSPLGDVASSLKSYSDTVVLIDTLAIATSITMARDIVSFITSLSSSDLSGVDNFNIIPLGTKLVAYSLSASAMNLSAIKGSINAASEIRDFINSLSNINTNGITEYKNAVTELGSITVDDIASSFKSGSSQIQTAAASMFTSALTGMKSTQTSITNHVKELTTTIQTTFASGKTSLMVVGRELITALVAGMTTGKMHLEPAVKQICDDTVSSIRLKRSDFHDAGVYLAEGFANGIDASAFKAKASAVAMATAALEAAEEALGIASPSKETAKIGGYFGQGFVNSIKDYASSAYNVSFEMADSAKRGLSEAVAKIQNVLSNDIDTTPVIRPVLDLSEVKTGVDGLGSMFNNNGFVGVKANIGAIGSAVEQRRQNGNNVNVITAIDKLHKDLKTLSRPSYTIDGITYDDGSEVSEAIKTLVRAAKIERRV